MTDDSIALPGVQMITTPEGTVSLKIVDLTAFLNYTEANPELKERIIAAMPDYEQVIKRIQHSGVV